MSTNAMIAHKVAAGYECIYLHWDGYIDHAGVTLRHSYITDEMAAKLIALGDCSSLGNDLGDSEFYHRDRNEDRKGTCSKVYPTLKEAIDAYRNWYNYVWADGKWTIYNQDGIELDWDHDKVKEDEY